MPSWFTGSFVGRFYRCDSEPSLTAWSDDLDALVRACAFCRSTPPFDGDLEDEPDPLGHTVSSGVLPSVLWLREQERRVKAEDVRATAEQRPGYESMPRWRRREVEDEVRAEMLPSSTPDRHVTAVIRWNADRLFVLRRSPSSLLLDRLHQAFGGVEPAPCPVWSGRTSSLDRTARAVIDHWLGGGLTFRPSEFKSETTTFSLRSNDTAEWKSVVEQAVKKRVSFAELTVQVRTPTESVQLRMDPEGLFSATPYPSRGGLPRERLRRRVRAVDEACAMVRKLTEDI